MFRRPLASPQRNLLRALLEGATLKAHRYLDGTKFHRLHMLDGSTVDVAEATVRTLVRRRLLDSNKKFPAATYLLTDKGRRLAARLTDSTLRPLTAREDGP